MTVDAVLRALIAEMVETAVDRRLAELKRDDFLDTEAAANLASVTPATIRRWVRARRLRCHRAGNRVRVRRSELERLLRSGDPRSPEALADKDFG